MSHLRAKSEQELINTLCGTSGLSPQEALNTYFAKTNLRGHSEQEAVSTRGKRYPITADNLQELFFHRLDQLLSLSGPISKYSVQELLTLAEDASLTADQIFYPTINLGDNVGITESVTVSLT